MVYKHFRLLTGQGTELANASFMLRIRSVSLSFFTVILSIALTAGYAPISQGAPKSVTTKAQVINSIKNMKFLMGQSDAELEVLDGTEEACHEKYAADHPDNKQLRDAVEFCDTDPLVRKYYEVIAKNGDLQDWSRNALLAATRALKAGSNFESEFRVALNFQWTLTSYSIMASKKTWEVPANQISSLADAQNLYQEGYWIAQKYNSIQAKNFS